MGAFVFHFVRATSGATASRSITSVSNRSIGEFGVAAPEERAAHAGWESAMSASSAQPSARRRVTGAGVMLVKDDTKCVPAR